MRNMLSVQGLKKSFGGIKAVDTSSLDVEEGGTVGVIGPNGAGKTTLFNLISGFDTPDNGAIIFDGENIAGKPSAEIARMGLIRTFQLSKALTRLTVEENMMLAPQVQYGERIWNVWLRPREVKQQEETNREKAISLLESFGLLSKKDTLTKRILEYLKTLREEGMTFLVIEHDMHIIMQLSDFLYVLNKGKVIASGVPEEVRHNERVLDAYLG